MHREVLVIGAGPAGLGSAGALSRAGVRAVVVEKADAVGSAWRSRYDRLRLNTSRWTSRLPYSRFARGTPLFPTRDDVVAYLEGYAERNDLDVRLGTQVERIDRDDGGWIVRTSAGDMPASHVIVATGYENTPTIPDWPGRDSYQGRLLHAAEYMNAEPFQDADVLVVGPGCSGMEVAYDLAENGAKSVRLAVRTPPNIVLRQAGPLPGDLIAITMLRVPPRIADAQLRFLRPKIIGDLTEYGLPIPDEGVFTRLRREGKAPAILDPEVIDAIKERKIEIVAGVEALEETGVQLADGSRIEPNAVIAAAGYRRALEALVGHLGVLDERGVPRVRHGKEAAPGLRFIGFVPRPGGIGYAAGEAKRAAKQIAGRLRVADPI
jgi:cation diffusion facilitator CzcD-associated flavoprotein CzcO